MFKKSRSFVSGFLCCAVIFALAGTALAAARRVDISVVYNDIKLVVSGKEVIPKDANGQILEPFIYSGTTYLPVRAVAEALDQTVDWDGEAQTVYIGGKFLSQAVGLHTLKGTDGGSVPVGKTISVRGESIVTENCLGASRNSYYYSDKFILDGKYETLTGLFAVEDGSYMFIDHNNGGFELTFTNMDTGEVIAKYTNYVNEKPVPVNVNIIGVDKLQIVAEYSSHSSQGKTTFCGTSYLYNAELHPLN